MSKKKKKKNKDGQILSSVDNTLNMTYDQIKDEIENLQLQLNLAEAKARKKVAKKIKKDPNYFETSEERLQARKEVLNTIESTSLLDRVQEALQCLAPVVIVISRLIASLILAILSFTGIKTHIKPETLEKLECVYKLAMSIGK
jgi:hemoglobin-like flavoprotein